jgi:zinc protease
MRRGQVLKRGLTASVRRPFLGLVNLVALGAMLGTGAALAADTLVLHIPSTTVTLPNGLTVVVSAKDKLPIASISVRFKVGSAYDPEDKAGFAEMTARLLDKGTARRTATAVADELDFLGARLEASADGTGNTLSLSLLAKDAECPASGTPGRSCRQRSPARCDPELPRASLML